MWYAEYIARSGLRTEVRENQLNNLIFSCRLHLMYDS